MPGPAASRCGREGLPVRAAASGAQTPVWVGDVGENQAEGGRDGGGGSRLQFWMD